MKLSSVFAGLALASFVSAGHNARRGRHMDSRSAKGANKDVRGFGSRTAAPQCGFFVGNCPKGQCCGIDGTCGNTAQQCNFLSCDFFFGVCGPQYVVAAGPSTTVVAPTTITTATTITAGGSTVSTTTTSTLSSTTVTVSGTSTTSTTSTKSTTSTTSTSSSTTSTKSSTSSTTSTTSTSTTSTKSTTSTSSTTSTTSSTTTSASPSSTILPGSISIDSTCGKQSSNNGNWTCVGSAFGNCCSNNGYCGSTSDFCAFSNCQSGNCLPVTTGAVSPDGTCGKQSTGGANYTCVGSTFGNCCSNNGYCGSTSDFCAFTNCQSGNCLPVSTGAVSPDGTCGKQSTGGGNFTCVGSTYGSCCSVNGYCGNTTDFCAAANCQSGNCLTGTTTPTATPSSTGAVPTGSGNVSPDGTCGPTMPGNYTCAGSSYGTCCSLNGYCGSTSDYCGAGLCYSGACAVVTTVYVDPAPTGQPSAYPNIGGSCGDGFCDVRSETCYSCTKDCGSCDPLPDPYIGNCDNNGQIHMSWDDGPSNFSSALINTLAQYNVKVTFFLIGERLDRGDATYIAAAKQAYAAGHTIGSHTYTHPYMTTLTDDEIRIEMLKTEAAIYRTLGIYPRYMRLPYSDVNERVYRVIQNMGYLNIFTSLDPNDSVYAYGSTPLAIEQNYVATVSSANPQAKQTSFISDMHDTLQTSVNQTAYILNYVQKQSKFKFVPITQCVSAGTGKGSTAQGYRTYKCGDGICDGSQETCATCPQDCGKCPSGTVYTYPSNSVQAVPTVLDPSSGAGTGGGA